MRRLRARRRRGEVVLPVPIAEHLVVGWLLDTGWLAEADAEDAGAVAAAIGRALREICTRR
jgi:Trk K+ transport system NAD-binding subunit